MNSQIELKYIDWGLNWLKKERCKLMKKVWKICHQYNVEKIFKKTQIQKTPFHAFLLGSFGWNYIGQNTMKSYGCPP